MGNNRKLYAHLNHDEGLVAIHSKEMVIESWEAAEDVVVLYLKMWDALRSEPFIGDFYALWNDELYVFTQQPMCPVVWQQIEYGKAIL